MRTAAAEPPALSPGRLAPPSLTTAPGYEATLIHRVEREAHGSWVSLAADPRGRLYASDQYGPIYQISLSAVPGTASVVTPLPLKIGGAHGLAWIADSLYAVVGQKTPSPPGLYRLRDTNGDGELDQCDLLRELAGEGEHGPHAVVAAPDGRSLFVIAGNGTRLPPLVRSRVPHFWAEDSLLTPLPALMGSETRGVLPGGWIGRTDLEGREWELHAVGLRNAYALACDAHGEVFTFDSDTEFELNLPWYRPTRVLHALSGADFGWRRGALKIPAAAAEAWPDVLPMGLGSPTAVLFPRGARLPASEQDALWVADWSYGKLFALTLTPTGSTFAATRREIVSATPLPITAVCANPVDGSLYFTTGGRRMHSALYRLRWTGPAAAPITPVPPSPAAVARRELETWHGREAAHAIDQAWPFLGDPDRALRQAARTAVESQPVATWRNLALKETNPARALTALLALARVEAASRQSDLLGALRRLHDRGLGPSLRRDWLRVLSLTFSRSGAAPPALRSEWRPLLEALRTAVDRELAPALLELLVYCESPAAAPWGFSLLQASASRQAQLDFARPLTSLTVGWTPPLRHDFFGWLAETSRWRGGGSFNVFLQRLRDDALASAPAEERAGLRTLLEHGASAESESAHPLGAARRPVRSWTTDDIVMLVERDTRKRDPVRGRRIFGAVGCFGCHGVAGEGGALGPDLTAVTRRLALRDLIEAIVEPSREISDQYGSSLVTLRDRRQLAGRIVNLVENGIHLAENIAEPAAVTRLANEDVVSIVPSRTSLMPAGLINLLADDEILDLLAFLRSPAPSP